MTGPDPIALTVFGFPIYWYGVMISGGMLLGVLVSLSRAKHYHVDEDRLLSFLLFAVPLALVFSRISYVLLNWPLYSADWRSAFALREGGLSIHGGIIGGAFAAVIYTYKYKINFWRLGDLCAPGLILGQAVGRWGNYFNQEAYGIETNLPWAMYIAGALRHPTFLYESVWNMLVFGYLLYMSRREKVDGTIFIRYLIWYSAGRYFIEGLRTDSLFWGNFRAAQLLSLVLIHGGLILLWWMKRQARRQERRLAA